MKKFFTLIACALVAGSAFAQDYKDLGDQITNGKIAYNVKTNTDDAYEVAMAKYPETKLVNFVSAEWVNGTKVTQAPRVVADDPATWESDPDGRYLLNYYLAASTREVPQELDDEGNPKFDDEGNPVYQKLDPWDSRFYITLPIDLAPGDKVTFSMKVRAKRAATISAQGHGDATGNAYKVYRMQNNFLNNIEVPDDQWLEYAPEEFTWADADDGVNTFAFDIGASASNEFYFDDIVCKVKQKVVSTEDAEKPAEPTGYVIYENRATDLSTLSVKYFKNYTDAAQIKDGAIVVTSLDADKSYADLYTDGTAGSEVKLTNNWDTQFLITLPYAFQGGDKFHLYFGYKADEKANGETQCHYAAPAPGTIEGVDGYAGSYIYYSLAGNVTFTPYWNWFDADVTVPNDGAGMQAIAFNLNVLKKSINYYFKDVIVTVDENDVPTFITEAKAKKASKSIFNAAGQQMKSLQKGLNIVDGQKVYVK